MTRPVFNPLEKIVRQTIKRKGHISFSEYMDLALYHPRRGYYSHAKPQADFYTSADVHPIFSEVLAKSLCDEWKKLEPRPTAFFIVELGCGEGKLARRILDWCERHRPDLFEKIQYRGIEVSAARRKSAEKQNRCFKARARFQPEFDFPDNSVEGVIFSNEFFDAVPFDRVASQNGRLLEMRVGGNLAERVLPASVQLKNYFKWIGRTPPDGCRAEAHLLCRQWMRRIGRSLRRGFVLTIDYGYSTEELYSDLRPYGTALCHYRHQTNRDYCARIGRQDITAHVNFTALAKEGQKWGLVPERLATQSRFLLHHGMDEMVTRVKQSSDPADHLKITSAIKSLIHPEGMGGTFKVLLQKKP